MAARRGGIRRTDLLRRSGQPRGRHRASAAESGLTWISPTLILVGFSHRGDRRMTEHLSRLTLTLEVDAPLERARVATLGPHLHGVLMESIPADYVQTLHTVPVNPYSQYALARSTTSLEWKISTLTNEARQQIVGPINDAAFAGFRLRASGIATQVTSRSLEQNPLSQFARIFYARPETRKFRVEFLTPTAFKQSGEYVFWPDPRLASRSIYRRHAGSNSTRTATPPSSTNLKPFWSTSNVPTPTSPASSTSSRRRCRSCRPRPTRPRSSTSHSSTT